jgi:hypothetical protein
MRGLGLYTAVAGPLVLVASVLLASVALAQSGVGLADPQVGTGTGYNLTWWTVDGGGSTMVGSGAYTLSSTAGQPDAGVVEGNGYTLSGGFWAGGGTLYRLYLPLVTRASP